MNYNPIIPCKNKRKTIKPARFSSVDIVLNDIAGEYTTRCFQQCKLCYGDFGSRGKDMSLDQVKHIKKQFDLAKITTAHLTGGEILWHRNIEQIIKLFGLGGYRIEIDTNGVLIDRAMARLLEKFAVEILVGIESLDPDLYHWYRGTDSIGDVLKGLDIMLELGMKPGIQIIAANFIGYHKKEYNPIKNIFELLKYATGKGIRAYLLQYRSFGRAGLSKDMVSDLTREQKVQLTEMISNLSANQRKLVSGDLPYSSLENADYYGCMGGILSANMDIDGNVFICNWMRVNSFGNIFHENISDISKKMKDFRLGKLNKLDCRACKFKMNDTCFGPCLITNTYKKMIKPC